MCTQNSLDDLVEALTSEDVRCFDCGGRVLRVDRWLRMSELTPCGLERLLKALLQYTRLESLDMRGTHRHIRDEACFDAFVNLLVKHPMLKMVNIGEMDASPEQWRTISAAIDKSGVRFMYAPEGVLNKLRSHGSRTQREPERGRVSAAPQRRRARAEAGTMTRELKDHIETHRRRLSTDDQLKASATHLWCNGKIADPACHRASSDGLPLHVEKVLHDCIEPAVQLAKRCRLERRVERAAEAVELASKLKEAVPQKPSDKALRQAQHRCKRAREAHDRPVSYTHLTLPTTPYV